MSQELSGSVTVQSKQSDDILKVLQKFQPLEDFYVYPAVPSKKLTNARKTCAVPEEENILGLVDCTVFGSAKDCVLFGEKAIYHYMLGTHGKIYYSDLPQSAFVWQGNLVLALGSAYGEQISTAGSQVLAAKLRNIINALRRLFMGNEPETAPIATDVPQILGRLQPQADLYVAPGIPRDKLMNAREKCAVPEGEHILGLIDCTVFGSAKDCVLFGEKAIYYHNMAGGEGKILYSYLPRLSFSVSGSSVLTSEGERINTVGSEINAQELQNILLIIQQLVAEPSQ